MGGLLEVRGLTVELPTPAGCVRPVNEVSLRINKDESGSGKTMLSLAVMGLSAAERARLLHLSLFLCWPFNFRLSTSLRSR